MTDSCTEAFHKKPYFKMYLPFFWLRWRLMEEEGLWTRRAGREGKAPQMKILNQYALLLQLRPRLGLHLIYSLKPGNQAIKRNQTIRFPALNGPTVWCGQSGIRLNPFEVADKHQRQQPCLSKLISFPTIVGCRLRNTSTCLCVLKVTQCVEGWHSLLMFGRCWRSLL